MLSDVYDLMGRECSDGEQIRNLCGGPNAKVEQMIPSSSKESDAVGSQDASSVDRFPQSGRA